MNVLYVSNLYSRNKLIRELMNDNIREGQVGQKFHRLLAQGISKIPGINLELLSISPIPTRLIKKKVLKQEREIIDNYIINYIPYISMPVLRHLSFVIGTFVNTCKWIITQKGNKIIICDVLKISALLGCLLAARIKRCNIVGIATDIPTYRVSSLKLKGIKRLLSNLFNSFNLYFAKKCDGFVLLTEKMNDIINPDKKPFVVVEGLVDSDMIYKNNELSAKYKKKVCHYAGSLMKIYGLDKLVRAFVEAGLPDAELHIYGGGAYEEELKSIVKDHQNIKYFGYVSNDIIVEEQLKSTLLINPRPTDEEYTKYSFPSKNMEYMASGTPALTTVLPGMPEEYKKYVYLIEDESVEGIKKALENVLAKSREELHEMGKLAKEFVLREKNNIIQAGRILEMIKSHIL